MAKYTKTVYICDRCLCKTEINETHEEYGWTKFAFIQWNGPYKTHIEWPDLRHARDICPNCLKELQNWWGNKK